MKFLLVILYFSISTVLGQDIYVTSYVMSVSKDTISIRLDSCEKVNELPFIDDKNIIVKYHEFIYLFKIIDKKLIHEHIYYSAIFLNQLYKIRITKHHSDKYKSIWITPALFYSYSNMYLVRGFLFSDNPGTIVNFKRCKIK